MTTLRLTLRQHRFALVSVILLGALLTVAAIGVGTALSGIATPTHCIEDRFRDPVPPACATAEEFLTANEELAGKVMAGMALLPLVAGVLAGVGLIGSEIETRTAMFAWTLSTSRRRWLATRLAIVGLLLFAALAAPAIAAGYLAHWRTPDMDPTTTTFLDYGLRGPVVVARGLAIFAVAVLVGLVLGRVLPAVIVAGLAAIVLYHGVLVLQYGALPAPHEIRVTPTEWALEYGGPVGGSVGGSVVVGGDGDGDGGMDGARTIVGIHGRELAFVPVREVAVLGGLTIVLLGASLVAVDRRRPY